MSANSESLGEPFPACFEIGSRVIGKDNPPFIIAEGGVSHFGDFKLAIQLFEMAAAARADAFKLQVFEVDETFTGQCLEWKERLRPRMLEFSHFAELRAMCRDAGMEFILTFHDASHLNWIERLELDAIKVGSGEKGNTPFLRQLGSFGLPVIVSTGMHEIEDVTRSVDAIAKGGCSEIAVLHCVTSYPTPHEELNLNAIEAIRNVFPGPVGYSDHTANDLACIAAVACGAKIIEKHITVLRDVPNAQDWKVSCDPENFSEFVTRIRQVDEMLGSVDKRPAVCESDAMEWALKSIVSKRNLEPGCKLTEADLAFKRAGGGIPPDRMDEVLGKKLKTFLKSDSPLTFENLE